MLASENSGLGEALKKVPFALSCVEQSEDPKDWANAIKAVHGKDRKLRLREAKVLQGEYAGICSWQNPCNHCTAQTVRFISAPLILSLNLDLNLCMDGISNNTHVP